MIDLEKRKRIMQRSIQLGHCICNPRQDCPCAVFKEKNICLCAGERMEDAPESVPLTTLVENTGCASKISQNDLKKVLAGLPDISHPDLLVGTNTCDDAGVYKIRDDMALVQTVDVFTPLVDDPYTFGQVAAANAVSDVYAMGGTPLTALSIIAFPIETLHPSIMTHIIRGGMDKLAEAGVTVVGGHSIKGEDIKFGFAVTGLVDPRKIVRNDRAQPGDVLVLTKPLGVGAITFAHQLGRASQEDMDLILETVTGLNRIPAETMVEFGVTTATDVTGFSLLGHLSEIVSQSGVEAELYVNRIPVFGGALDYLKQDMVSGAIERNREYASQFVSVADDVAPEYEHLLYDPQTSGGLLICIPEEKAEKLVDVLKERGVRHADIIGKITGTGTPHITVRTDEAGGAAAITAVKKQEYVMKEKKSSPAQPCCANPPEELSCCSSPPGEASAGSSAEGFGVFMERAFAEGALTLETKELMAIALSLVTKCEPCVKIHLAKARSLGISEDRIDEAVWLAIAFGGAPVKMFYNTITAVKQG
jgi:selenide,water dikinase